MTVRVSKPEFNLREKLSELDKPVGLHGNEILKSETPQDTFDLVGTGRKNMVINGDMRVSQRHGTGEVTPSNNTYTLDQMRWDASQSSKFKVQQVTDAPTGFSHSMKVTSLAATSQGSTDFFLLQNFIEGKNSARLNWGTSDAQPVTLSFYVKSSIAGIHPCGIRNRAYNRSIVKKYKINMPNSWEYKTVTFPGCTDGTWETGIHAGLKINFGIGAGSNFEASPGIYVAAPDFITSDSVNVLGTNGATWYITGIQLESGKLATPFEHRHITDEMTLCERYYQNSFIEGNIPGTSTANGDAVITTSWGDGNAPGPNPFRVAMRTDQTVTLRARGSTTVGQVNHNGSSVTASAQQIGSKGIAYIETGAGASAYAFNAFTFELNAEMPT